ncbi:hypothetical protein VTI74DRAFT_8589 [Chaetomium olivicolor]
MLLTSAQVSVAVSSGIIILCTAALFLSGYVIQQRTLRDLRAAIKPAQKLEPLIFLPDRFKKQTTELPGGSIIELEDDVGRGKDGPVIEVRPTIPDNIASQKAFPDPRQRSPTALVNLDRAASQTDEQPAKTRKQQSKKKMEGKGAPQEQQPMSRAERRKRIRQEIIKSSQAQDKVKGGYHQRKWW